MSILSKIREWWQPKRVDYEQPETPKQAPVFTDVYTHLNSKNVRYYLNKKKVTLRGGKEQWIYYFSKDIRPEGTLLPEGWTIRENPRNGFLTVRKPGQVDYKPEDDDED